MARAPDQLFVNGKTRFSAFSLCYPPTTGIRCETVKSMYDGVPYAIPFGIAIGPPRDQNSLDSRFGSSPKSNLQRPIRSHTRSPSCVRVPI
jgi:hypothetical protein